MPRVQLVLNATDIGADFVTDPCSDPRLAPLNQHLLYRLLAVTDMNERDHSPIAILVETEPHKPKVAIVDK